MKNFTENYLIYNEVAGRYDTCDTLTTEEFEETDFYEATIEILSNELKKTKRVKFKKGNVTLKWYLTLDGEEKDFTINVEVYDFARHNRAQVDGAGRDNFGFFGFVYLPEAK